MYSRQVEKHVILLRLYKDIFPPSNKFFFVRKRVFQQKRLPSLLGKTVRLIKEYEAIIEEYENQGYIVNKMLNHEVKIESQLQWDINQMSELQGQIPA